MVAPLIRQAADATAVQQVGVGTRNNPIVAHEIGKVPPSLLCATLARGPACAVPASVGDAGLSGSTG